MVMDGVLIFGPIFQRFFTTHTIHGTHCFRALFSDSSAADKVRETGHFCVQFEFARTTHNNTHSHVLPVEFSLRCNVKKVGFVFKV